MTMIGLVGGTGDIGRALGVRLAKSHERILIGSRTQEKAESTLREILEDKKELSYLEKRLQGVTNEEVVSSCETVILTVPYDAAIETVTKIRDKFGSNNQLLISTVAAIEKNKDEFVPVRNDVPVSKKIQELVPDSVSVAAAFQTIPARVLYSKEKIDADVFVCCNEKKTYLRTAAIVSSIEGLRSLYAGSLELASEVEGLTAMLLNISRSEHLKSPTFKILSF
jgi:NADPH-dependent F420 reductase